MAKSVVELRIAIDPKRRDPECNCLFSCCNCCRVVSHHLRIEHTQTWACQNNKEKSDNLNRVNNLACHSIRCYMNLRFFSWEWRLLGGGRVERGKDKA